MSAFALRRGLLPAGRAALMAAAALAALAALPAATAAVPTSLCPDDAPPLLSETTDPQANAEARQALQALLQQALSRSQAVGASRLLTEAAASDVEEARLSTLPRATLSSGVTTLGQRQAGASIDGNQWRADLSVGAPLFDAGRSQALAAWRERLLEAASLGEMEAREQVKLQTVLQALERQRYQLQSEIYGRYVDRMGCLVGALERIVEADRGRASELLQVRNTLRQAELALALSRSQQRQAEIRLRRLAGDNLPAPRTLQPLSLAPPPLERTLQETVRSSAVLQLQAQVDAQSELLRAQEAERKPQASWSVGRSRVGGSLGTATSSWNAGVSLSVPLLDLTARPALQATAQRADSAREQLGDTVTSRLERVAETHEQAQAAFERARASADVLQGSQRLRESTLLQWQQLGRRSLFDVISTESEYHNLLVTRVNALLDGQQASAQLWSLGRGVQAALEQAPPTSPEK